MLQLSTLHCFSFWNEKKSSITPKYFFLWSWWWWLMNQSYQIILNSLMPAGLIFFCLSLFTRYSPGLYMIGRVRNRIFFWNPCFFQVWKRKFQSQFCLRSDTYEFKCFSAKKTGLWLADLSVLPIRGLGFFGGKPFELICVTLDSDLRKNLLI